MAVERVKRLKTMKEVTGISHTYTPTIHQCDALLPRATCLSATATGNLLAGILHLVKEAPLLKWAPGVGERFDRGWRWSLAGPFRF